MKTHTIITVLAVAAALFSAGSSAGSLQPRHFPGRRRWRCPSADEVQCILPGGDRFCCPMSHTCGENMEQCSAFKPFGRRPPPPPPPPPPRESHDDHDPAAKSEGSAALSKVQTIIILSILLPLTLLSAVTTALYFIHRKRQRLDFEGPASRSTVNMCMEAAPPAYLSRPGTSESHASWMRSLGSVGYERRAGSSGGGGGGWEWTCKGVPPSPVKELEDDEEDDGRAGGKEAGIALTTPGRVYLKREYSPAQPPRRPRTGVPEEQAPPLPERRARGVTGETESEGEGAEEEEEGRRRRQ